MMPVLFCFGLEVCFEHFVILWLSSVVVPGKNLRILRHWGLPTILDKTLLSSIRILRGRTAVIYYNIPIGTTAFLS